MNETSMNGAAVKDEAKARLFRENRELRARNQELERMLAQSQTACAVYRRRAHNARAHAKTYMANQRFLASEQMFPAVQQLRSENTELRRKLKDMNRQYRERVMDEQARRVANAVEMAREAVGSDDPEALEEVFARYPEMGLWVDLVRELEFESSAAARAAQSVEMSDAFYSAAHDFNLQGSGPVS